MLIFLFVFMAWTAEDAKFKKRVIEQCQVAR